MDGIPVCTIVDMKIPAESEVIMPTQVFTEISRPVVYFEPFQQFENTGRLSVAHPLVEPIDNTFPLQIMKSTKAVIVLPLLKFKRN